MFCGSLGSEFADAKIILLLPGKEPLQALRDLLRVPGRAGDILKANIGLDAQDTFWEAPSEWAITESAMVLALARR